MNICNIRYVTYSDSDAKRKLQFSSYFQTPTRYHGCEDEFFQDGIHVVFAEKSVFISICPSIVY